MELRETGGVDSDASARHSWASGDDTEHFPSQRDPLAVDRSRFGFRPMSRSDATSVQSDGLARFDEERFAGFQRSREASEDHDHHDDAEYEEDEEEEEEEEDDDDDVRRSWTTEKEPVEDRFGGAIDLTSFRFRRDQHVEDHEEEDEDEQEDEQDQDEEERDSDASFASLEWVTRQLRQLERRQRGSSADTVEPNDQAGGASSGMDDHVREALNLLNGNGGGEEEEEQQQLDGGEVSWAKSAADRRDSYFDIVQEAMAVEWRHEDGYDDDRSDHDDGDHDEDEEHQDEQEEEEEEDHQSNHENATPEDAADEWLEAFTAKGRVYYYNRRTRESSWTKPESLERSSNRAPADHHDQEYDHEVEHGDEHQSNADDHQQHEQEPRASLQSDHGTGQSSTSSTSSSNQEQDRAAISQTIDAPSNVPSNALFCFFCGTQVNGTSDFQSHFSTCATLNHHKQTASPLYTQFQQMLVFLSEDMSLRSLHYASSFPDAKPHPIGVEPPAQTQQSVRESLTLLRVKHRSNRKPVVHRDTLNYEDRVPPSFQPVQRQSSSASASSKRSTKTPPREPLANRYASMKQKPIPVALLNMETCRHCGRSFAEGRLAKHEAVCPRVFGNEHAWGRGPSTSVQKKSLTSELDQSYNQQRSENMLGLLKKKHHANLKHTLALSFQEHQASLVECPCCRRKFAPSGAQQHIDICKTVQHRPRNPVPLLKDYALAG